MGLYHDVKLCLLGDSGVGKSSIAQRFVNDVFYHSADKSTLGASFLRKTIVVENSSFRLNIWDTAGQEKYRALVPMYSRDAEGAILVYDITDQISFNSLNSWIRMFHQHASGEVVLVLAGNKCDLEKRREVSFSAGKAYADSIGAFHVETSALTDSNITEIFHELCLRIPKPVAETSDSNALTLMHTTTTKKKCC